MLRSRFVLVCVLIHILAGSATVHADDSDETRRAGRDRTFGELGFSGGERQLGVGLAQALGLVFALGIERGKYSLIGELHLGHLRGKSDPAVSGFDGEAGLYLRRDAVSWPMGDESLSGTIGVWVDLGAAAEMMWFGDDAVYRPEVSLGIGGGPEFFGRKHSLGITFDVRLVAAPAVQWDGAVGRCAGACGMTFSKLDLSVLTVVVFPFSL